MKPEKIDEAAPVNSRSDRDLETYEELPEKQKELQRLQDLAEKTSGPKKADLHRRIRRQAGEEGNGGK